METIKRLYQNIGDGKSENILDAIMNNDCKYVIKYVEEGNDIYYIDEKSESFLHKASRNDNYEIVDLLIKLGLNVNEKNQFHDTPLHLAVQFNNLAIVDRLIFKGAIVNSTNKKKITPLHLAAKGGGIEIINLLIANQAKISANDENGVKPIHFAAQSGNEDVIRTLLNNGASLSDFDDRKNTVLHYACWTGNDELVAFIVRYLSVSDLRNLYGNTALHMASRYCHKQTIELLIKSGYNPTNLNNNLQSPLDIAIKYNMKENSDYLRNYIISRDYKKLAKREEIYVAASCGNLQFLIQKVNQNNINEFDYFGRSILYYAICSESMDIIEFLVEKGANIDVIDEYKQSALLIAMYSENLKIIEFFLKNKANVNEIFYNRSYLYRSISRNNYDITRLLISYDADITYIDYKYRTIFSYALEYASDDIIELLVEKGANMI